MALSAFADKSKRPQESDLPDTTLAVIDDAKKYAEGRAVRIEIRNKKDLENVKKLSSIKMPN